MTKSHAKPSLEKEAKKSRGSTVKISSALITEEEVDFPPLEGISRKDMGILMFQKRIQRMTNKQQDTFQCFVQSKKSFSLFLLKLQQNINQLPDKTRFQIAIQDINHWFFMDCYIKDEQGKRTLNTLTIDATGDELYSFNCVLDTLKKQFPTGHHSYFNFSSEARGGGYDVGRIQRSVTDCQTFVREHAKIISKKDPDQLYNVLLSNTHKEKTKNLTVNPLQWFNLKDCLKKASPLRMLADIFRSKQFKRDVDNEQKIMASFGNIIVSADKQKTFKKIVEEGKHNNLDKDITLRGRAHSHELADYKNAHKNVTDYFDRSGFGLVVFPVLARIQPDLKKLTTQELEKIIHNLARELDEKAPTDRWAKLKKRTTLFVEQLHNLAKEITAQREVKYPDQKKLLDLNKFSEMVRKFASYLEKNKSQRTSAILNNFFESLEIQFQAKQQKELKSEDKEHIEKIKPAF